MYLRKNLLFFIKTEIIVSNNNKNGFTFIETLVVILTLGILSAIAAVGWQGFINRQKVNTAQSQAFTLLHQAKSNAGREKLGWQVCFWDDGKQVLAAVHRTSANNQCQTANGEPLIPGNSTAIKFTSNFAQDTSASGRYRVQFKHDGSVNGQLGRITFTPRNSNISRRCVIVSTLIGAMRTDKDTRCGN